MTTVGTDAFDLQRIQRIRKWAIGLSLLAVVVLAMFSATWWGDGPTHEAVESVGLGAIVLSIVGREVFTAYVPTSKGPVFMKLIESAFGTEVTTRTLETVAKCAAA